MVTEFLPRGNVWQLLHRAGIHSQRSVPTLRTRNVILDDAAQGMAYLHARQPVPTLHRDLKSPNLLLDAYGRVKARAIALLWVRACSLVLTVSCVRCATLD